MKKTILFILIIFIALIGIILANSALADITLKGAGPAANIPAGEAGAALIVGNIIKGVLAFSGALLLLMFIYGGFIWLTSAGIGERIEKGKNILIWAIIGFVIMLGSYIAVDFIIKALVGR